MTRPEIIRADSIDLQDRDAPSAQEHQRSKPTTNGSLAPHQAETLREVAAETAEEKLRSPRVSWANGDNVGDLQQQIEDLAAGVTNSLNRQQQNGRRDGASPDKMQAAHHQDALAIAQNGGVHEVDEGDIDGDNDVDMDDDMLDKISSSPSIEDGGSTFTSVHVRSRRVGASSHETVSPCYLPASPIIISDTRLSFPYLACPERAPPDPPNGRQEGDMFHRFSERHCHLHQGEYPTQADDRVSSAELPQLNDGMKSEVEESGCRVAQLVPSSTFSSLLDCYEVDTEDHVGGASQEEHQGGAAMDDGLTIPYETDEDDDGDLSGVDSRYIDSGWGGECLQDTEDIDFEFVYALHTFVATVEGQANATKGDTMVLLDDSNSYWWLVRVVKDSSIGYLPAEHIETPTERLARLNKHRNIDLSATMLGDQAEKSRNPLKSAIKRRKTKAVHFAAEHDTNTYELDYSTEEEDLEAEYFAQQQQLAQQQQQAAAQQAAAAADVESEDETAKVEPLKPRSQQKVEPKKQDSSDSLGGKGTARGVEEVSETKPVDGPKKTSDGTVRDSFFKDDTVETKKITLTPNLLRDDNAPRSSNDSKELKQRPSLDKLDKDSVFGKDDKKKKDKKEKEKKPSAIRSFFSRKDKKTAKGEEDDDSFGKHSLDTEVQERELEDEGMQSSPEKMSAPQRTPSKLQKQQPRTEPSPTRRPGSSSGQREPGMDLVTILSESRVNNVANVPPASMRIVDPDLDSPEDSPRQKKRQQLQQQSPRELASPDGSRRDENFGRPTSRTGPLRTQQQQQQLQQQNGDLRPQKVKQAKMRTELDDFDSLEEEDMAPHEPARQATSGFEAAQRQQQQQQQQQRSATQGMYQDSYQSSSRPGSAAPRQTTVASPQQQQRQRQPVERLSESPVQVSPVDSSGNPPPLMIDTGSSSQEEEEDMDRSSSARLTTPSPELLELDQHDHDGAGAARGMNGGKKGSMATSTTSNATMSTLSTSNTNAWNDESLRAFFDSGSDIRDLLVVVYDKTDVAPAGPEHPIAGSLFKEQNAKLAEITTQLDNMLGDWLARKQRTGAGF
ncbi:hypothetical protein QBC46DRAFT_157249 [Diplogelasinospora grovesii]|uniref:SH3 domain-containing protein n=1 Tax=Diplogelasinospora grovesii TaxID=303347 RepID=A0AAN6NF45_9PEZI|nr:hypothetical protein QBC46DRAFT_157249 [Diplogelasinospora grovesii]